MAEDGRPLRVGVDLRAVPASDLRGIARYVRATATELVARDDVELVGIVGNDGSTWPFEIVRARAGSEVFMEQLWLPWMARRLGVDVLWCPANRGLPLLASVPTVLTVHDTVEWDADLIDVPRGRSRLRFSYASVMSLASASLIITPSDASAADISERLKIPPKRLRVVHEAAAASFSGGRDRVARDEALARYGLGPGYILYVGGPDAKKDVPTLLRALHRVDRQLAVRLVVCGPADDRWSRHEPFLRGLDVTRLEDVPDVDLPSIYGGAACFASAAFAEGFGLPHVEAMMVGAPVLAADSGAVPAVVGGGGRFFRKGDDEQLARLIEETLRDPACRALWSERALTRARAFSWSKTAAQTLDVLTEASGRSGLGLVRERAASMRRWRHWLAPKGGRSPSLAL